MSALPTRPPNETTRVEKPPGARTPYPVEHPGISDQPGTQPDYLPGKPGEDLPKM